MTQRNQGKTAVVGWGRGMGHKGHMLLATAVIHQAEAMNATPIFILSRTSLIDPSTGDIWADTKKVRATKDDPLSPQEKLAIYQKTFPDNAKIFTVADGESGSLNDALTNLAKQGFTNIVLVVGKDQKDAFQYLVNPSKDGTIPYQQMGLRNLVVMSRQETQAPGSEIEGPRATPMRKVLLDPAGFRKADPNIAKKFAKLSDEQMQFAIWRDAMPDSLSDEEVYGFMQKAQQRLGRAEQIAPPKQPRQQKIKEFIQRVRPMLKEASLEKKLQVLRVIKEAIAKDKPVDEKFEITFADGKKETIEVKNTGREGKQWEKHAVVSQIARNKFPNKEITKITDMSIKEEDEPAMTSSGVPWQGPKLNREVITPPEGLEWRFGKNTKEDPKDRADARHFGTAIASVPNPITKAAGMMMRYAGQDPKDSTNVRVAKAMDSTGNPDEISRYLKKKAVKEQGKKMNPLTKKFEPEDSDDEELYQQGLERNRFPHYHKHRDEVFSVPQDDGSRRKYYPGTWQWEKTYKDEFDLPSPKDPIYHSDDDNPLVEIDEPFNLEKRHSMDYGMRKTMIRRIAKATDYDVSDLSLASDEELSELYQQVFPDDSINEDYLDEK